MRETLARYCPDFETTTNHHAVPAAREDRLIVGGIRSPYDWYPSVYRFALQKGHKERMLKWAGDESFEAILYKWTHPDSGECEDLCPLIFANMSDEATDRWFLSSEGLWSACVRFWYEDADLLIDTPRLNGGLSTLLGRGTIDRPRLNTTVGGGQHWTPEMQEWVHRADGDTMRKYGYVWPSIVSKLGPTILN